MNNGNNKANSGALKATLVLTFLLAIFSFIADYIRPPILDLPEPKPDFFSNLKLEAKSVYVFNMTTSEEIYAKDSEKILPLASITKIMPVVTALDILGEDYEITITERALREENDDGLKENEKWKLKDLAEFSLIVSSNDGLKAIGLETEKKLSGKNNPSLPNFLNETQKRTYDAGIYTRVINTTGLDMNDDESGSYGTAKGAAQMLAEGLRKYPEIFFATGQKEATFISENGVSHKAVNTNKAIKDIPQLIASKTGLTDLAGGNLVVAIKTNMNDIVLISILGSSENGRFADIKNLSDAVLRYSDYYTKTTDSRD